MKAITPELKDSVLNLLCKNFMLERHSSVFKGNVGEIQKLLEIDFNDLNAILTYFQRIGFISDLNCRPSAIHFVLKMEASDFQRTGGFTLHETILESNVEQLTLEIQVLKKQLGPDHLDTVNKIASIVGTIFSSITAFKK